MIRPRFSHKPSRTAQHTHVGHESSLPDSPGTILFPTMPNQTDSWNRSNLDLSATHLPSSWLKARVEKEVIWSLLSFATGARESIAREEPTANVSWTPPAKETIQTSSTNTTGSAPQLQWRRSRAAAWLHAVPILLPLFSAAPAACELKSQFKMAALIRQVTNWNQMARWKGWWKWRRKIKEKEGWKKHTRWYEWNVAIYLLVAAEVCSFHEQHSSWFQIFFFQPTVPFLIPLSRHALVGELFLQISSRRWLMPGLYTYSPRCWRYFFFTRL